MPCRLSTAILLAALTLALPSVAVVGCIEGDPFSWIGAEWEDCRRVAVRHTQTATGGYEDETVFCDSLDVGADSELRKACDFFVAEPPECSTIGDTGPETSHDSEVSPSDDAADDGPEDALTETLDSDAADSGPATDVTLITAEQCAAAAPQL